MMIQTIATDCIQCDLCTRECSFLKKYGSPGKIATHYIEKKEISPLMAFECNLCGLCTAVCPRGLDPSEMFFVFRKKNYAEKKTGLKAHATMVAYEKKGRSERYSLTVLPEGCKSVFFPGCALAGTRPERTEQVYDWLKQTLPAVGIVLNCCSKPSLDMGKTDLFHDRLSGLASSLTKAGVREIITACPNCHTVFSTFAVQFKTITVYEMMAEKGFLNRGQNDPLKITIHDACVTRNESALHESIRCLVRGSGNDVLEMPHSKQKTICCGEGGAVSFVAPQFSSAWKLTRKQEASETRVLTYCAGCHASLRKIVQTDHILDLLFDPDKTIAGKVKVSRSPFTWLNRLRLKRRLKKGAMPRNVEAAGGDKKKNFFKLTVACCIALTAMVIRLSGFADVLDLDTIREFIQGFGYMGPVIYILVVSVAPAFLLPGAPFIIAGGVLFGSFWGVVYGITGATTGACLAFLVSRYVLRDWIESKLTGPRWEKLKIQTETHGWKIVAVTRLIPLFPFNLLSYGLGLTRIKFLHYFIASFICMLPGCIAYILLSNSLISLAQGTVTMELLAGGTMLLLLILIPLVIKKRYFHGEETTL